MAKSLHCSGVLRSLSHLMSAPATNTPGLELSIINPFALPSFSMPSRAAYEFLEKQGADSVHSFFRVIQDEMGDPVPVH